MIARMMQSTPNRKAAVTRFASARNKKLAHRMRTFIFLSTDGSRSE